AGGRASGLAAAMNAGNTPVVDASANCASASERDSAIVLSDARSLRWARESSIILAMKMVQVASEARASPIMTAFTMTSADRNIDHGDRSRGTGTVDFSDLALSLPASGADAAGTAVAVCGAGSAAARAAACGAASA